MSDIWREPALTLAEAAKLPELQRNGKRPHIASLFRWSTRGCRGVRLETRQVGGSRCTSRQAVLRFLAALNNEDAPAPENTYVEQEQAERELQAAGF